MKIILASNNNGKIKEFQELMPNDEVLAYKTILGDIKIIEDQDNFQKNAIKKAQSIYDKLKELHYDSLDNLIVISDDSGISVPVLNNEPGIYSARYAGEKATDKENNQKLILKLDTLKIKSTPAYYTCCIAIVYMNITYTVHGWMYGNVINKEKGILGFGYDPLFVPKYQRQTLAQLDTMFKKSFSHRSKALDLAKKILDIINNEENNKLSFDKIRFY